MTTAIILSGSGAAVAVIGSLIAVSGLIATHDANADKTIATIVRERAANYRQRVVRRVRRWLRKPANVVVMAGTAQAGASMGTPTLRIGWQPLDPSLPVPKAIEELDRRLRDVVERYQVGDDRLSADLQVVRRDLAKLRDDVAAVDTTMVARIRRAAIQGLLREAIGLALVVLGTAMQSAGAFLSAR